MYYYVHTFEYFDSRPVCSVSCKFLNYLWVYLLWIGTLFIRNECPFLEYKCPAPDISELFVGYDSSCIYIICTFWIIMNYLFNFNVWFTYKNITKNFHLFSGTVEEDALSVFNMEYYTEWYVCVTRTIHHRSTLQVQVRAEGHFRSY